MISKCGIYTSQGKRVLLATRAVVNGRKAVAYVKNGQLQGYEYLDDFNEQCYSGPYMTFEDKKGLFFLYFNRPGEPMCER